MDREDIRLEVRDILGEDSADFWKDAELNRYIREAEFRFLGEERWPWLITEGTGQLTAADPDLELEEGIAATRHINITLKNGGIARSYQPKRVTAAEGFRQRARYAEGTTGQYPDVFYTTSVSSPGLDGVYVWVVRFVPTPTSDVDVEYQYFRTGSEMDADDVSPLLPVEYHKALVHYAAGTAWLKELNGESKAGEQFQMYAGVVEQARGEWLVQSDDDPLIMGDSPDTSMRGDGWLRDADTLSQPLG